MEEGSKKEIVGADVGFGHWSPLEKYVPTWRGLSTILELRLFSRLYIWLFIVPVAVKAFEKLPDEVDVSMYLGKGAVLVLNIPFNWFLLYLAAIFFVAARLCFIYACPKFLREFESAGSALERGLTAQGIRDSIISYLRLRKAALRNREKFALNKLMNRWGVNGEIALLELDGKRHLAVEGLADLFINTELVPTETGHYENLQNRGRSIERDQFIRLSFRSIERFFEITSVYFRILILMLLSFGFVLLTIVFGQGFLAVAVAFWDSLTS